MRLSKLLFGLLLLALASLGFGGTATIRLSTFPSAAVADARSTIAVTAEVRDLNGRHVPNGTEVVFVANPGEFQESVVKTVDGYARAVYVAGAIPGMVKITASSYAFGATSQIELELVSDRSLLSTANEYIEVVAPAYLMYSMDLRLLGAAGPNKGVYLRYKGIEIEADDIQLNVSTYELKARKAHLKMGSFEGDFGDLYLVLNRRRGFGTAKHKVTETALVPLGTAFTLSDTGVERERFGLVTVSSGGVTPFYEYLPPSTFEFEELGDSVSMVASKKATVFPNKEIQFQKAEIYMGDAKVMKMPLFSVNLMGGTPLLTDQILNVDNNQLSINYPHYLSLKPGLTSLLRFRMGDRYGARSYDVSRVPFLDYELSWNRGDEMQGSASVTGLTRSDWGLNARQFLRLDDRTTMYVQTDMTALRSLAGSGSVNRQFDGFQVSLSGNNARALRGLNYSTEHYSFVAEKDPTKIGSLPMRLYYGLVGTHSSQESTAGSGTQTTYGLRARAQLLPIDLDRKSSVNASFSASKLQGHNAQEGLTLQASANLSYRASKSASLLLTYDYFDDSFNQTFLGKQRVSLQGSYYTGKTSLNVFASRGLDADRMTLFIDASHRLSNVWKLAYTHTYDQFLASKLNDYTIGLIYTFGMRDFGLTFNARTKRFGIQVLGASFN